ncbi:MAG: thioether cross-link-forming SCIFF peptide maturase [Firmicutes bacterium]|nr:thioether cross-link-forming SCIFF peptide maturase [Bacillota bacterium]
MEGIKQQDIHTFKYRDLQLVYDVNSGSLHAVDNLGWEAVNLLAEGCADEKVRFLLRGRYPADAVEAALQQVDMLRREGVLFAPEPQLERDKLFSTGVRALCLFITHSCNLGCRYCFTQRDPGERASHMTPEVGKKAVDFLLAQEGGVRREIDFFGGEPLLNFSVVREIVDYARENAPLRGLEFDFTLTTNATLLDDEKIDFLNREDINVILSLDGRPAIQNRMRSYRDGRGSYERTVQNITRFLESRGRENYYIRGTYTRYNLDFSRDIEHFLALGLDSLSLEPVVSQGEGYSLQAEDLPLLEREYDRLVDIYLEQKEKGDPFLFYHFLLDLEKGPCLYKRLSGCGAGGDYLAVASDGTLYPCHQFVGIGDFYMGNVTLEPPVLRREIGKRVVDSAWQREACHSCWARYLCGRGCAATAYFMEGALHQTNALSCALQKIRLERALYLQAV